MISKINELIDANLNLICETEDQRIFATNFLDIEGYRISSKFESENFADEMVSRKLIKRIDELCIVEEYGYEIFKNGGWKEHLDRKSKNVAIELAKVAKKEDLEIEIKLLQKDNLEYQKKIREQSDRIRDLDEQIKFISLIKLYWWLIPTCIAFGIFLAKCWDLIKQ